MTRLRYSVIAGTVGFLCGNFFQGKFSVKNHKVFADSEVNLSPTGNIKLKIHDPHNSLSRITEFGIPIVQTICPHKSYVSSYDCRNRVPYWVLEHLTSSRMQCNENVSRHKCVFFEDESINKFFRSTISDYKGSSYDKGHLATAENHKFTEEDHEGTFVLSNIAPQVGNGFNRGAWQKLEKLVRHYVKQYKNVFVCTGPLFLPMTGSDGKRYVKYEVIGPNDVAVPTHFFKVILCETKDQKFHMVSYIIPNTAIEDSVPLNAFLVPKEVIERAAGFLLFEKLPPDALQKNNGLKSKL